jgi:hypothetical protein
MNVQRKTVRGLLCLAMLLLFAGVAGVLASRHFFPGRVVTPARNQTSWQDVRDHQREEAAHRGEEIGPICCRLTALPPAEDGGQQPDLRLELMNVSEKPVSLWYSTWPYSHVTFVVLDGNGEIVGEFHYGSLSSQLVLINSATGRPDPARLPPVLTLQPGETYSAALFSDVIGKYCDGPAVSGRYRLRAVFSYKDVGGFPSPNQRMLSRSNCLPVRIGARGDANQADWNLLPDGR